jgi:cysteinyl-tRNA synthetase
MAVTWDLARSTLSDSTKKATILLFDQVLGLGLEEWAPAKVVIPDEIMELVEARQKMRQEKRWADADAIRDQILASGFEVEDTPQGPHVKSRS